MIPSAGKGFPKCCPPARLFEDRWKRLLQKTNHVPERLHDQPCTQLQSTYLTPVYIMSRQWQGVCMQRQAKSHLWIACFASLETNFRQLPTSSQNHVHLKAAGLSPAGWGCATTICRCSFCSRGSIDSFSRGVM